VGLDDARVIPLQSPTPVRTPGLIWLRGHLRTPAMRTLAGIIRERVSELNLRRLRGK